MRSIAHRARVFEVENGIDVRKEDAQARKRLILMQAGLDIEEKNAKQAKSLGFFPSRLIFIPLPVKQQSGTIYKRSNDKWKLELNSSSYGLPYGVYPRIELARIVSLAVKTKTRELSLKPVSQHLREFGIAPSGGKKGTIQAYRNQMLRLFSCTINRFLLTDNDDVVGDGFRLIDNHKLWTQHTSNLYPIDVVPYIKLSECFFNEITGGEHGKGRALPFDLRAVKALKQSALQIDLYLFLTYRFNSIRHDKHIPWVSLKQQFGENYANTSEALRNFKKKLIAALKRVLVVYPDARIAIDDDGLWLKRSRRHV